LVISKIRGTGPTVREGSLVTSGALPDGRASAPHNDSPPITHKKKATESGSPESDPERIRFRKWVL